MWRNPQDADLGAAAVDSHQSLMATDPQARLFMPQVEVVAQVQLSPH